MRITQTHVEELITFIEENTEYSIDLKKMNSKGTLLVRVDTGELDQFIQFYNLKETYDYLHDTVERIKEANDN